MWIKTKFDFFPILKTSMLRSERLNDFRLWVGSSKRLVHKNIHEKKSFNCRARSELINFYWITYAAFFFTILQGWKKKKKHSIIIKMVGWNDTRRELTIAYSCRREKFRGRHNRAVERKSPTFTLRRKLLWVIIPPNAIYQFPPYSGTPYSDDFSNHVSRKFYNYFICLHSR